MPEIKYSDEEQDAIDKAREAARLRGLDPAQYEADYKNFIQMAPQNAPDYISDTQWRQNFVSGWQDTGNTRLDIQGVATRAMMAGAVPSQDYFYTAAAPQVGYSPEQNAARIKQFEQYGLTDELAKAWTANWTQPYTGMTTGNTTMGGGTLPPVALPDSPISGTMDTMPPELTGTVQAWAVARGIDPNAPWLINIDGSQNVDTKLKDIEAYLKSIDPGYADAGGEWDIDSDGDGEKDTTVTGKGLHPIAPPGMSDEQAASLGMIPRGEAEQYTAELASITPPGWKWVQGTGDYEGEGRVLKSPDGKQHTLEEVANDPIWGNYVRAGLGVKISTQSGWQYSGNGQWAKDGETFSTLELVNLQNAHAEGATAETMDDARLIRTIDRLSVSNPEILEDVNERVKAAEDKFWAEVEENLAMVFPDSEIKSIYESLRFDEGKKLFRAQMQAIGRTDESEALVKYLFPEADDDFVRYLFNEPQIPTFEKWAELRDKNKWFWEKKSDLNDANLKKEYEEYVESIEGWSGFERSIVAGWGDLQVAIGGGLKYLGVDGIGQSLIDIGSQYEAVGLNMEKFEGFKPEYLLNGEWWAGNVIRQVPVQVPLIATGMAGVSFGSGLAVGLGVKSTFWKSALIGFGASATAAPLESLMEAGAVYDMALKEGLTPAEAKEAADEVFLRNLKTLGISNALEFGMAFSPFKLTASSTAGAISRGLIKTATVGGKVVITGLTNAGQEVYQDLIAKQALADVEFEWNDETETVAAVGFLFGGLLAGAGSITDFTSGFQEKFIANIPPKSAVQIKEDIQSAIDSGTDPATATTERLNQYVEENPKEAEVTMGLTVEEAKLEHEESVLAPTVKETVQPVEETVQDFTQTATANVQGSTYVQDATEKVPADELVQTPDEIYDAALAASRKASKDFRIIQQKYRAREVGDEEFLAGEAAFDKSMTDFDKAETAYIEAKNAVPVKPTPKQIADQAIKEIQTRKAAASLQERKAIHQKNKEAAGGVPSKEATREAQPSIKEQVPLMPEKPQYPTLRIGDTFTWPEGDKVVVVEGKRDKFEGKDVVWARTKTGSLPAFLDTELTPENIVGMNRGDILKTFEVNEEPLVISDIDLVSKKIGSITKALESYTTARPVLVYQAEKAGTWADGFALIEDKAVAKELADKAIAKAARSQKKTEEQLRKENTGGKFPDYKQLFPTKVGEPARLVGVDAPGGGLPRAFLSDGKSIVTIQADYLALMHKYLPDATIHFTKEMTRKSFNEGEPDVVEKIDDPKSNAVAFKVNGKIKGLLMPMFVVDMPQTIKDAATGKPSSKEPIKEKPSTKEELATPPGARSGGAAAFDEFKKQSGLSLEKLKMSLAFRIEQELPLAMRGKLLREVAGVQTKAEWWKNVEKAKKLAEAYYTKQLKTEIKKELEDAKPHKVNGILKGKLGGEIQELLEIRANMIVDRSETLGKITANQAAYERGEITPAEMVAANLKLRYYGIESMSSSELKETLEYIQELKSIGKDARKELHEQVKEQQESEAAAGAMVVSGGKTPTGEVKSPTFWDGVRNQILKWQFGLTDVINEISSNDKSKPFDSKLSHTVDDRVQKSENAYQDGLTKQQNSVLDGFMKSFGVKTRRQANNILRKMGTEKVSVTFNIPEGGTKTLELTKGQLIDIYNLLQSPENFSTFERGNKIDPIAALEKVSAELTAQEKAWADWQREFLDGYYDSINEVYEPLYGVNLGKHDNYWMLNRDVDKSDIPAQIFMQQDMAQYASVAPGSVKARTKNIIPFEFKDANQKLIDHIIQMEHFKAWAFTIRDLRAIFMDKKLQSAIKEFYGKEPIGIITEYMNDLARGGITMSKHIRGLDKLRGNVAVAMLGIKPMVAFKQITGIIPFMTEMPYGHFLSGVTDFLTNPGGHYKTLYDKSSQLRARYTAGQYERDINVGVEGGAPKHITKQAGWKEQMLFLIQTFDRFAAVPGMWAKYQSGLKQGLTDAQAILEAEKTLNRTQNTSQLYTRSSLQRGGSALQLFTMFQDNPNKFFRLMYSNFSALAHGRQSKAKSITNLAILWVVIPALFQFLSDGLKWKEDRQMRAWLLGPVNNLLVFGQLAMWGMGKLQGQPYGYQPTPILPMIEDFATAAVKGKGVIEDWQDPAEDVSIDDVWKFIETLAEGVGAYKGVPTPYIVQVEKAIREGRLPEGLFYSAWALKDDNKSNDEKSTEAISKLGSEGELTPDEEAAGKKAPIYGMNDLDTELAKIYDSVLPSQIKSGDPIVKSWAEKETAYAQYATLPNVALKELAKYDGNGENIVDYYTQWQDRQKITNLADLKAFDKLYPNAKKGNVTKREYDLILKYMDTSNKTTFLRDNPELNLDPQEEYLKKNIKENALLALWGDGAGDNGTKLFSKEAYDELQKLAAELDIPDSALPKGIPPKQLADKYFAYYDLTTTSKQNTYRENNPALDAWGHIYLGWTAEFKSDEAKEIYRDMMDIPNPSVPIPKETYGPAGDLMRDTATVEDAKRTFQDTYKTPDTPFFGNFNIGVMSEKEITDNPNIAALSSSGGGIRVNPNILSGDPEYAAEVMAHETAHQAWYTLSKTDQTHFWKALSQAEAKPIKDFIQQQYDQGWREYYINQGVEDHDEPTATEAYAILYAGFPDLLSLFDVNAKHVAGFYTKWAGREFFKDYTNVGLTSDAQLDQQMAQKKYVDKERSLITGGEPLMGNPPKYSPEVESVLEDLNGAIGNNPEEADSWLQSFNFNREESAQFIKLHPNDLEEAVRRAYLLLAIDGFTPFEVIREHSG